jgi:hypothetical protein
MDRLIMKLIFSIFFFLAVALPAQAFELRPDPGTIGKGTIQQIIFRLDTGGEEINAIEGAIRIPQGARIERVSDANSVVGLWLERPHERSGAIAFAGMIPGGYEGSEGVLLNLLIEVPAEGDAIFTLEGLRAYLNDGQGTSAAISQTGLSVTVVEEANALPGADRTAPENFQPQIVKDPEIEGGKYVLLFETQDKGSGMDHYEIMEVPAAFTLNSDLNSWQRAESPYLLKDQSARSKILVRAVDREGNFIIVTVPPAAERSNALYVILAVILICLFIIWRFRIKKLRPE